MKVQITIPRITVTILQIMLLLFTFTTNAGGNNKLSLESWTYIQVDNSRTRYDGRQSGDGFWFGLAMGDLTGDGHKDIVSGKWFYRNPGNNMEAKWHRVSFPDSIDVLLIVDVDGDKFGDVIGAKCNKQYWFEAEDAQGTAWTMTQIGELPVCNHGTTTQGYAIAQLVPGGKPEILLHGNGIYYMQIPDDPKTTFWPTQTVIDEGGNGEWLGAGDINGDGFLDICAGFYLENRDLESNNVVWLENPKDGSGGWTKHIIGKSKFRTDKAIPGDFNGDGRLDVAVTEERWPGLEPDASLYWFEAPVDPTSSKWIRHHIVTQYSMNNLDVADMDQDGDMDLITCEHKGPAEKLQIWENNGKGVFIGHTLDEGKESHLGSRVADMDNDGDLDIISIAWNDFEYVHLWRNDAIMKNGTPTLKSKPLGLEPVGDLSYRLPVEVSAGDYERWNRAVEMQLDFTEILKALDEKKAFDAASIRVVEVDVAGNPINKTVYFQFELQQDYDAVKKASGTLVFELEGNTPASTTRFFHILFGVEGGYFVKPVFPQKVHYDDFIQHEGYQSFRLATENATYFYHKKGSGFASMIDLDGNDWIGYHPEGGDKGSYRGIPNIAPPDFHPGPGENNKVSRVISQGPMKLSILSETADEQWGCIWDIYPYYATMTLFKKGPEPYWILYEGTPGGRFDLQDYFVTSDDKKFDISLLTIDNKWNGDLPAPEWVYFGASETSRVLYYVHHEYSEAVDEFWHFGDGGMTVFGFGRGPREEGWQRLTQVPTHLTIGFAEENEFSRIKDIINSVYQPISINIGNPELNKR